MRTKTPPPNPPGLTTAPADVPEPLEIDPQLSPARLRRTGDLYAVAMVYLTDPVTRKRSRDYARNAALFAHANQLEALVRQALPHMPAELADIARQVLGMIGPQEDPQKDPQKGTTTK